MAKANEIKKLIRALERQGWAARTTGSGHWRVTHPGGKSVTIAATPRNERGIMNAKADLRRVDPKVAV